MTVATQRHLTDPDLVAGCLRGDQRSWDELVRRYKNLVWVIVARSGAARGEESDAFQAIWLDVYAQLHHLRKRASLRAWITTLARHKCYHWRRRRLGRLLEPLDEDWAERIPDREALPAETLERIEKQQQVREAIGALSERCRTLLDLLFLRDPPRPYREVARRLGLAVGSIGFTRGRCLEKLRQQLLQVDVGDAPLSRSAGDEESTATLDA